MTQSGLKEPRQANCAYIQDDSDYIDKGRSQDFSKGGSQRLLTRPMKAHIN